MQRQCIQFVVSRLDQSMRMPFSSPNRRLYQLTFFCPVLSFQLNSTCRAQGFGENSTLRNTNLRTSFIFLIKRTLDTFVIPQKSILGQGAAFQGRNGAPLRAFILQGERGKQPRQCSMPGSRKAGCQLFI